MAENQEITQFKPVMPLTSPEEAVKIWTLYEDIKSKLLTSDDYQTIQGKTFIKRSGWRKIAVFFGISDIILEQERMNREDESFMCRVVVEARAPNGRTSIGIGVCDSREREFAHPEHDILSTAHTRAKSRAISDLVGGGAVSAEEIEANTEETPRESNKTGFIAGGPGVRETIEKAGLDVRQVELRYENGSIKVYPTVGLENFNDFSKVLMKIGYSWRSDSQRWEADIDIDRTNIR